MFLTSWDKAQAGADPAGISGRHLACRNLVDTMHARAEGGGIAIVEIASGESAQIATPSDEEKALFALTGEGRAATPDGQAPFSAEDLLFIPSNRSVELAARETLRLLVIYCRCSAPASEDAAAFRVIRKSEVTSEAFHQPDLGFHHVAARWLVNAATANSGALIVGQSTFSLGGAHLLHRHASAEEFFMVLEGGGHHLLEGKEIPMSAGDLVFTARSEWHGFRNAGSRPVRALFGYFGASRLDQAGYEVHSASVPDPR